MKKILRVGFSFFLFLFVSCDSNETLLESQETNVEHVSVVLEDLKYEDASSRLALSENMTEYLWQDKDTLGIFPNVGGQVEFPITGEDVGKKFANFTGGGWALRGGYFYSAYYPYNFYNRNSRVIPISYLGQVQKGNDNRNHLRQYMYFASAPVQVANGVLAFNLQHAGVVQRLTLTMPVAKNWSSVSVYSDTEVFPVKSTLNLQETGGPQTAISYSDRISIELNDVKTTQANQNIVVWLVFPVTTASTHPLKVMVRDSEGYAYVANVTKNDGTQALASFNKGTIQLRKASPTLQSGMNSGISGWEDSDEDYGGTLK